MSKKRRVATLVIYFLLIAGICWQIAAVAGMFTPGGKFLAVQTRTVNVSGDVRRPGLYRVPEGTTQFEILKVAGVRPTSDLSAFNLMAAVGDESDLNVGTRDSAVAIKPMHMSARIEFFFGDVMITANKGGQAPARAGLGLVEGDRLLTDISSQAEISVGAFSRIDMDAYTDLSFDKIGAQENGRTLLELFQKTGTCWYKTAYSDKNEKYRILTPNIAITVEAEAGDFLVEIQPDRALVNLMDGAITIDRTTGTESINLISGQTVTAYNDGRPFQIASLAPDMGSQERFTMLNQEKKGGAAAAGSGAGLNFLFCGQPAVFFVVSMQPDKGTIYTVSIPTRLTIEQFAQGMQTFDEAMLYGGPSLAASVLERILTIRLTRYAVFTRDNILKTADLLGGISMPLDGRAAAQMRMSQGTQKLKSPDLAKFLSAANATPDENKARQRAVLDAIFDGMRNKSLVLTSVTSQQILNSIESNFSSAEVMDFYMRFVSSGSWKRKDLDLPVQEIRVKGRVAYEPVLNKCRGLLENN